MRQMSPGKLHARINFVELNGLLLNREHWSHSVSAIGATPAGYLALGGPCTERTFKWHGTEVDSQHFIYGFDAADAQFLVPGGEEHWVILVPKDLIISHLGEESAADLLHKQGVLRHTPKQRRQLITLVNQSLVKLPEDSKAQVYGQTRETIRSELLDIITETLCLNDTSQKHSTPKKRYIACRKAIIYATDLNTPIRVPELAAVAGVSQRVLELGFQETLGMSPQKFLRLDRLNKMHRDLRSTQAACSKVTDICNRWGFHELGRTAVEYKRVFGESPSSTLHHGIQQHGMRLADALSETTNR
jgi:AraC family ethanolamine operon transcriptional activator